MHIKELTIEKFNSFSQKFNQKSLNQTVEYGQTMNNENISSMLIGLIDNNEIVAASLILISKISNFKYAYVPRGFLIDYTNKELINKFTAEIKKYLGKNEVVALKISPMIIKNIYDCNGNIIETNSQFDDTFNYMKTLGYHHYGYHNSFEGLSPRFEAILKINRTIPEIFVNIKKNFRTKIRSANKNGIKIYRGSKEELKYLYSHIHKKYNKDEKYLNYIYDIFNQRNKIDYYYAKLDTNYYLKICQQNYENQQINNHKINQTIMKNANKNSSGLLNKKIKYDKDFEQSKKNLIKATNLLKEFPEGLVIASTLIVKDNENITLFMDGFNPRFKTLNAKHLLFWKIIEKYSELGYKNFNLGGLPNITIDSAQFNGLKEFKLSFGPNIIEYIGDLELVTNNTLYFLYRRSLQIKNILKK